MGSLTYKLLPTPLTLGITTIRYFLFYKAVNNLAQRYLSGDFQLVAATSRRSLRSSDIQVHYYHYKVTAWGSCIGWWLHCTVVEGRSLTGELSLSHARPVPDVWPLMWVKSSATGQPTRPTQPFILSGSINWVVSWSRCAPHWSGDAIWWMLTKWMQGGSFHSWINVWVAGKTVWIPCHLARSSRWSLFVECKRWTDCISFAFHFIWNSPPTHVRQPHLTLNTFLRKL